MQFEYNSVVQQLRCKKHAINIFPFPPSPKVAFGKCIMLYIDVTILLRIYKMVDSNKIVFNYLRAGFVHCSILLRKYRESGRHHLPSYSNPV